MHTVFHLQLYMQNIQLKKIYISVSDFGCGFLNTIASDLYCKDEVEAILCGVYKKKRK